MEKWETGHCRVGAGREIRGTVHRMCPVKGYVNGGEGISMKDEVVGNGLGLSIKVMVVIAEPVQMEES